MDSGDLRTFLAFADAASFTAAARVVHLSQPAVFAIVKRLGDDVGAALYEKRGRALVLTDAGRALAAHARDVDAAERELRRHVAGADESHVVLACGEGALTHVIAEGVAAFARAHPRTLRVTLADGPGAADLVRRRAAHVAVTAAAVTATATAAAAAAGSAHADLVERALVKSHVVAVGTRALLASGDDDDDDGTVTIASLAAMPLLLPPKGRPLRGAVDDAFAAADLVARVDVEVSGWGALVMLARLGCGVALVNDVVKAPPGLVVRRVEGLAPVTYRTLSHRKRTPLALELLRALHHA